MRWKDQARGGGAGGVTDQSGGFSGSAGQYCSISQKTSLLDGARIASTCIPHLIGQVAPSWHGAFLDGVSQQGQSLAFAVCMDPWQSLMASAAAISACADCASWSAMRIAAHANVIGVNVRDVAIKIARMTRKRYREGGPRANCACTSYLNVYVARMMADREKNRQQVLGGRCGERGPCSSHTR
jgi:hypothetical protein